MANPFYQPVYQQAPFAGVPNNLLRATILADLVNFSRPTLRFFTQYFKNPHNGVNHPILGDLHEFADIVEALETARGVSPLMLKSAANFIRAKINPAEPAFVPASSML